MNPNKPTGETMSEGSSMPPEPNEMEGMEADNEETESPIKQYFESLDPTEKEELCSLVHEYEASEENNKELDTEGLEE